MEKLSEDGRKFFRCALNVSCYMNRVCTTSGLPGYSLGNTVHHTLWPQATHVDSAPSPESPFLSKGRNRFSNTPAF